MHGNHFHREKGYNLSLSVNWKHTSMFGCKESTLYLDLRWVSISQSPHQVYASACWTKLTNVFHKWNVIFTSSRERCQRCCNISTCILRCPFIPWAAVKAANGILATPWRAITINVIDSSMHSPVKDSNWNECNGLKAHKNLAQQNIPIEWNCT